MVARGDDPRCGTTAGYQVHMRRGTAVCDACREAKAEYIRAYRAAGRESPRARQRRLAYDRALALLAKRHSDEFARLVDEQTKAIRADAADEGDRAWVAWTEAQA